jgi:hypothetical protein
VTFGSRVRAKPVRAVVAVVVLAVVVTAAFVGVGRGSVPDLPTTEVKKGEFVDAIEIRGEIRPLRSVVLTSPTQSGELQIVKLTPSGTVVKPGDVVVEFDGSALKRTMQEKQSELKQADAEIEQASAQARITRELNATELMRSRYNIERAKLDVNRGETVARLEIEKAKLALTDAEQKLQELEAKIKSDVTAADADLSAKRRKREKALFDFQRAERGLENLQLKAPTAGMVNVLTNYRAGSTWGGGVPRRGSCGAWRGGARAPRSLIGAPRSAPRRNGSRAAQCWSGSDDSNRGDSRPRVQSQDRAYLGARPRRLFELAADAQLRLEPRVDRDRSEDPSKHDRDCANCHRSGEGRRRGTG